MEKRGQRPDIVDNGHLWMAGESKLVVHSIIWFKQFKEQQLYFTLTTEPLKSSTPAGH